MIVRYDRILLTACVLTLSAGLQGEVLADVPFSFNGPSALSVDTNPGTDVSLTANLDHRITDLNIFVEIVGGHMEDFDLFLTSPAGTVVQFRRDFATPNLTHIDSPMAATFDDESINPHGNQTAGAIGTFQPWLPLSVFDGESLLGNWTLIILDDYFPGEGNNLISWQINGTAVPEPSSITLAALAVLGLGVRRRR